jgi:hypothetical protein
MLDVLEIEETWVAKERNRVPRSRAELAGLIDYSVVEEALASLSQTVNRWARARVAMFFTVTGRERAKL